LPESIYLDAYKQAITSIICVREGMESNQKYQLLLVEDEADIVTLLTYNLEKEGYKLKIAPDGRQALQLLETFQPDLILMDIMLPHLDGIETVRRIREIPQMEETIIVFLTARSEEYAQIAAFDSGADDYITKPIKPRALLSRIQALLKRKSRQESNPDILTLGGLIIDKQTFVVTQQGRN
jgi:two-component system alkaline phosphatase synthesis response regulator PhoP